MSELDGFFKFKIGDSVKPKAHGVGFDEMGRKHVPQLLIVVERWLIECHGGVQMQYMVRAHALTEAYKLMGYSFVAPLIQMSEPELEEYVRPALTPKPPPNKPEPEEPAPLL